MTHPSIAAAAVVMTLGLSLTACGDDEQPASTSTERSRTATASTTTTSSSPSTDDASDTGYRAAVTKAAAAWLKTLSAAQRETATYAFDDTTAKQAWSNFPAFFKPRTGVSYGDMTDASDNAALALARTMLSAQGYEQYEGIRDADDDLGSTDDGGGPGGGGGSFGRDNFYVSVFGTPSADQPYMVSLNGHHSSFNITFDDRLSATPEFVGVEPSSFEVDSTTEEPMKDEAAAVFGMLPKLPASAKLDGSYDDVLVGPQKDGQFPAEHEGVKVTDLPAGVREQVTALITAYVGDAPEAISEPVIAGYEKEYSDTYVSYAGGTTDTPGTYVRVDGPGVWIELAVQSTDKGTSHYHSVYRDKRHDYGAA